MIRLTLRVDLDEQEWLGDTAESILEDLEMEGLEQVIERCLAEDAWTVVVQTNDQYAVWEVKR